jgi:transposase
MHLKTLLNRVHAVKGFVYEKAQLVDNSSAVNGAHLEVQVRPRRGSLPVCSGCGQKRRVYDHQAERRFEFVPLWGLAVILLYTMRRVDCRRCGVKIEWVPWARPGSKSTLTLAMELFLARWARRLSWSEVAVVFSSTWEKVQAAVAAVVEYGLAHRDLSEVTAIGVDEVAYAKGHRYATLVYQIDEGRRRLLSVTEGRTMKSLLRGLRSLGKGRLASIRFVCSDMWKAYLTVIRKKLPEALHILDRYHIVANLNKAIDEVRAWRLKESLHALWEYKSPTYAGRFLDEWCRSAMRSRLDPVKRVARSLRTHRELIVNWFRAKKQYSAGIVEGLNSNVKLRFRKARGFRTFDAIQVALYHELGELPEPFSAHRFC